MVFREGGVIGARSLVRVVCCGCLSGTSFGTGGYVSCCAVSPSRPCLLQDGQSRTEVGSDVTRTALFV